MSYLDYKRNRCGCMIIWSIDHGELDDIVMGPGSCVLAYINEALELDPYREILSLIVEVINQFIRPVL